MIKSDIIRAVKTQWAFSTGIRNAEYKLKYKYYQIFFYLSSGTVICRINDYSITSWELGMFKLTGFMFFRSNLLEPSIW